MKQDLTKDKVLQGGLDAVVVMCRHLEIPWSIKGSSRKYSLKMDRCTVQVGTKVFSEVGDDCELRALKAAVFYMIKTYQCFAEYREHLEIQPNEEDEAIQGLA